MLEKDKTWDILEYGQCDISTIKDNVLKMISGEDDFANDDKNTNVEIDGAKVHLIYDFPLDWKGGDASATLVSDNQALVESIENLVSHLETFYDGTRARTLIAKLPPHKKLERPEDTSEYLLAIRRNHIPIITNDKAYFGVGATEIHMKEAVWYQINNARESWVRNDSDFDRYHLLIDIMPNEKK